MEDTKLEQNNVVNGFSFSTEKDAALAAQEQKKIDYLEERIHYNNPKEVLGVYQKAIRERIFKTPLGIFYLKHLQDYLYKRKDIADEDIPPIPLFKNYDGELRETTSPARKRVIPAKRKKSIALPMSILLNIVLVIAVISMFVITLNADQPNILNYEKAITDRYASWEQDLTEREQIIRERERELKIQEY